MDGRALSSLAAFWAESEPTVFLGLEFEKIKTDALARTAKIRKIVISLFGSITT